MVSEHAPDERRRHYREERDGSEPDVALESDAPGSQVLVECRGVLGRPDHPGRVVLADRLCCQAGAERGAVDGQHARAEQEQDKPVLVAVANAVVDEDAVVVALCDAVLAE